MVSNKQGIAKQELCTTVRNEVEGAMARESAKCREA